MNGAGLLLVLIIVATALVTSLAYVSRRKLISNREPIDIASIHADVSKEVSFEVFRDVLNKVGQVYSVDPELIRPEDLLVEFLKADSWAIDAGTEELNRWLIVNEVAEILTPAVTVLDLARVLERSRQNVH